MTIKAMGGRVSRAELFLANVSGSEPYGNLEEAVRKFADLLTSRVATGDLEPVLRAVEEALEEAIGRGAEQSTASRLGRLREPPRRARTEGCDPFYWG